MRKKVAIVFLAVFFIASYRPILNQIFTHSLNWYLKNKLQAEYSYEKIQRHKENWTIHSLNINKKGVYDFYAEKLDIFVSFSWKRFNFLFHIESVRPQLTFKKNIELSNQSKSKSTTFCLKELKLNVLQESFCINFFQKPFSNDVNVEVFSSEKQTVPNLEISYVKANVSYINFSFKNLKIDPYFKVLKNSIKDLPFECYGVLNGRVTIQKKDVIDQFCSHLKLKDVQLVLKKKNLQLDVPLANLELEYPSCVSTKNTTYKNFISQMWDIRSKIRFKGSKVKSIDKSKTSHLTDLEGFISYNPSVGPKWSINGISHVKGLQEEVKAEGKGFLNSLHKNWVEASFCFGVRCLADFKLFDNQSSLWKCYTKVSQLTENQFQLFQDLLSGFYPSYGLFKLDKINASFKFSTLSNFDNILEFDVLNFALNDLKVQSDQKIKQIELAKFNFKGSFNTSLKDSLTGIADIEGASFRYDDSICAFKDICGRLQFEKGSLVNSKTQLCANDIVASLNMNGPIDYLSLEVKIKGLLSNLVGFVPQKREFLKDFKDYLVEGDFTIKKNDQSELHGTLKAFEKNKEVVKFGFFFKDSAFKKISHGWVKGDNISLNNFSFKPLQLEGIANFTTSFNDESATFLVKGSDLKFENNDFIFFSPSLGNKKSDSFESVDCLQGCFNFNSQALSCNAPLNDCSVKLKKYQLDFLDVNGALNVADNQINFQLDTADSHNIRFGGNVLFQAKSFDETEIAIDTEKVEGKIEDLLSFMAHFNEDMPSLKGLKGNFTSSGNGFGFRKRFINGVNQNYWQLAANVNCVRYDFVNKVILDQISCDININSKGFFKVENLSGKILPAKGSSSYDIYAPYLSRDEKEMRFDLRLSNSLRDIGRICGMSFIRNKEYLIHLDSDLSHFFSSNLNIDNFSVKENKITSFELKTKFDLRDFTAAFSFLKDISYVPFINKINFPKFFLMNGILDCNLIYQRDGQSTTEIFGKNLCYNRFLVQTFDLKAQIKDDLVDVVNLRVNDINCNFLCKKLDDHLRFRNFKAVMQDYFSLKMNFDLHDTLQLNGYFKDINLNTAFIDYIIGKGNSLQGLIKGKGRFSIDLPYSEQMLQIETDLDIQTSNLAYHDYSFENKGPIRAYFSYNDGWILDGLTFDVFNADKKFIWLKCKIGTLLYQPLAQKYIYKNVHLFFPENFFSKAAHVSNLFSNADLKRIIKIGEKVCANQEINTEGELDFETSEWTFKIKEHQVNHNDMPYLFRDITATISQKALIIDSKYVSETFEFPFELKLYNDENMHGRLLFYEGEDALNFDFDFKNKFQLHSVVGDFHGVEARFQRDKDLDFVGSLKFDFKKIKDFAPPLAAKFLKELDMGLGYEVRGKLSILDDLKYQFQGIFTGKDIELGGCVYQTLMSNINIISEAISISDLKVSDQCGIFKIDKLDIFKQKNVWCFSIPNFKMLEFRPSLLQKINQPKQEIKPLVFREILLKDLKGELEDKATYKGYGQLSFINSFKRDHSVFDMPADFLGRIFGLDMELLIPVKGMASFELKAGKFYFSKLENAYSEGDRSKFFLAEKAFPHTLDVSGNLNIHIQMKHYVLFTFTESFILSIEGDVSDPKFSLKKKKTLFSSK